MLVEELPGPPCVTRSMMGYVHCADSRMVMSERNTRLGESSGMMIRHVICLPLAPSIDAAAA